ncbi:MAG: hypothetical protein IPN53_24085, partial [Comamonadaceae bacterium]|nr:hypothetical protein [Comamonadaceae bacterium]
MDVSPSSVTIDIAVKQTRQAETQSAPVLKMAEDRVLDILIPMPRQEFGVL